MGHPNDKMEWQDSRAKPDHRIGCLNPGLGSVPSRHQYWGALVPPGEGMQTNQPVPSLLQLAAREATDAFLQDWTMVKGFANPPWNLIPRVLVKAQCQGADLILVAPVWKTQPWYPFLLSILVDWPRLYPGRTP